MPITNGSSVSDWVMCGITLIYVIATLFILRANKNTVKISEKQLVESKKEFEVKEKLEIMPFLYWAFISGTYPQPDGRVNIYNSDGGQIRNTICKTVKLTNVGNGPAINLILFDKNDNEVPHAQCSFAQGVMLREECHYPELIFMNEPENDNTEKLVLQYEDLKGNVYRQETLFDLSENKIKAIHNNPPVFMRKMNVLDEHSA